MHAFLLLIGSKAYQFYNHIHALYILSVISKYVSTLLHVHEIWVDKSIALWIQAYVQR